jgi:hypothetical protein
MMRSVGTATSTSIGPPAESTRPTVGAVILGLEKIRLHFRTRKRLSASERTAIRELCRVISFAPSSLLLKAGQVTPTSGKQLSCKGFAWPRLRAKIRRRRR